MREYPADRLRVSSPEFPGWSCAFRLVSDKVYMALAYPAGWKKDCLVWRRRVELKSFDLEVEIQQGFEFA